MSIAHHKRDTFFLPSVHGWPIPSNNDFGMALGMCHASLDKYYQGVDISGNMYSHLDDDLKEYLKNRTTLLITVDLVSNITKQINGKTQDELRTETWDLIESMDPLTHPRILLVINEMGPVSNIDVIVPVILYHIQKIDDEIFRLWIYNPNLTDVNPLEGHCDLRDAFYIEMGRNDYPFGTSGLTFDWSVYGIMEQPYDRTIPTVTTSASASIESVSKEVYIGPDGSRHRIDTLNIDLTWNGDIIPYYDMRVDNLPTGRLDSIGLSTGDFYSIIDLTSIYGISILYDGDMLSFFNKYILPAIGGMFPITVKLRIDSSTDSTIVIGIDYPGIFISLDYSPILPEFTATFYTDWPSFFDNGYGDSKYIHGVIPSHVTVRDEYDEAALGEIPASQSVLVKGSRSIGEWDPNGSLAENLFGAGVCFGFINRKINCTKKALHFFDREEIARLSHWTHPTISSNPILLVEREVGINNRESFCLNELLGGIDTGYRIKDGFSDIDFDEDSFMNVELECRDNSSYTISKKVRFYARNRLIFTGLEPPHMKYLEMDLKDWILGPYYAESLRILEAIEIHSGSVLNPSENREVIEKLVNTVLNDIPKARERLNELILSVIKNHRRMMIREISSFLGRSKVTESKSVAKEIQKIRNSSYELLMNNLSDNVLGLVNINKLKNRSS